MCPRCGDDLVAAQPRLGSGTPAHATAGDVEVHWLHRSGISPGESSLLLDAVRSAGLREGRVFAWVAGEASARRSWAGSVT